MLFVAIWACRWPEVKPALCTRRNAQILVQAASPWRMSNRGTDSALRKYSKTLTRHSLFAADHWATLCEARERNALGGVGTQTVAQFKKPKLHNVEKGLQLEAYTTLPGVMFLPSNHAGALWQHSTHAMSGTDILCKRSRESRNNERNMECLWNSVAVGVSNCGVPGANPWPPSAEPVHRSAAAVCSLPTGWAAVMACPQAPAPQGCRCPPSRPRPWQCHPHPVAPTRPPPQRTSAAAQLEIQSRFQSLLERLRAGGRGCEGACAQWQGTKPVAVCLKILQPRGALAWGEAVCLPVTAALEAS